MLKKPQNVYLPIDKFQAKVFKQDEDKRGEWVSKFALALAEEAEDPFAKELLKKAQADLYKDILRGWRFNAKKSLESSGVRNPTDGQINEKCIEEFGDEYIEAVELLKDTSKRIKNRIDRKNKEITEDAPAREDGDGLTTPGNGALRNSLKSSGNSQDASTGNGEDVSLVRPATNLQHRAGMPRSATGIGGGRDARVTMSPSPEGAVQSGKVYNDQEKHTDKVSTDASCNTPTAKPIAATKTGGSATTPLPPEGTDDPKKAESRKGRTRSSNYSLSESVVDTDERVQSCEVLNLAYSGRNGLVVLSQEEYNRLLQETGNKKKADRLVDSLDYALAEGKEFNQKHINVLLHWKDYRDEKLIAAKYGKNFADRQDQMVRDNMQLADDIRNGRIAL